MKKLLGLIVIMLLAIQSIAQYPTLTTTSGSVNCLLPCTTITATVASTLRETTIYTVNSTTYSPYSYTAGTNISTATDDIYSSAITLPFTFCFFGNPYTQCVIGSNGNICFNTALAGAFDPWSISGPLPGSNCNATKNAIMSPWMDIYPPGGGTIKYATYGTAPNRSFVVSYNGLSMFLPSTCPGITATQQIVLHETTNIIDIYINGRTPCTGWNSGRAVTGVENAAGTLFYTAPGENGTAWTAGNEGWEFIPIGTLATWTYTWTGPTGIIATTPTATVCPTITTVYTCTAVANICPNPITLTATSTVTSTVVPISIIGDTVVCQNSTITLAGSLPGGTWTSSNTGIATVGTSGIVTGVAAGTCIITYTYSTGCQGFQTIVVNPIYHTYIQDSICQGNSYSFGGIDYTISGVYDLFKNATTGCDSQSTLTLKVIPNPYAEIEILPLSTICVYDTIKVLAWHQSSDILSYSWNFIPAILSSTNPGIGPNWMYYTDSGTYNITLVVKNSFCASDTIKQEVKVQRYPDASIAPFDNNICFGDEILFRPLNPTQGIFYHWTPVQYFFEEDYISQSNATAIVDMSRVVILHAMSSYGCLSIDSVEVFAHSCCRFEMPNGFTPNEDGLNDLFRPIGNKFKIHEFSIYNRWGQQVYSSKLQSSKGWDGTYNGIPQDGGTYYWIADYECEGKDHIEKGDVTLIR